MKYLALYFFFTLNLFAFSQTTKIEFYKKELSKTSNDLDKSRLSDSLIKLYKEVSNIDSILYYLKINFQLAQKNKWLDRELNFGDNLAVFLSMNGEYSASINLTNKLIDKFDRNKSINKSDTVFIKKINSLYRTKGSCYFYKGQSDSSLSALYKAYELSKNYHLNSSIIITDVLNLSSAYYTNNNIPQALEYYFMGIRLAEKTKSIKNLGHLYYNVGEVYFSLNQFQNSLVYYEKGLNCALKGNDYAIRSLLSMGISSVYNKLEKYDKALEYALSAKASALLSKEKLIIANSLDQLSITYLYNKNNDLAFKYGMEGLSITEDIEEIDSKITILNTISKIYVNKKDFQKAKLFGEKSLGFAQTQNDKLQIKDICFNLKSICFKLNNYKKAYGYQELYYEARDSVINEGNQRELLGQEFKYTYDKKSLSDSLNYINEKKISAIANQVKLGEEKNKRIALYVFLCLSIIIGAFIFNRFKVTQKQKLFIEVQSSKLEQAHLELGVKTKEINDSILYSKDIQNLFLKPLSENSTYFKDSLLIYKPKDIVSGDFYWYKEINDNLYVVIGDCTGHGVPGAIISVLAIQTLDRLIAQISDNSKLHYLNELINIEFNSYNSKNNLVNIGLDYSIMCMNKQTKTLYLSGSGSSMLLKNNNNELITEKFDSINIGGDMPFKYEPETKTYNICDVHALFLYTDGIIDQRGGTEQKRFGSNQLKELILNLNTNNSNMAYQKIEHILLAWQGDNAQIDDMTFFAIQFSDILS